MYKVTLSIKEASEISGLPASFIRKQIENGIIPNAYFIQHRYRKTYIIYTNAFEKWVEDIQKKRI